MCRKGCYGLPVCKPLQSIRQWTLVVLPFQKLAYVLITVSVDEEIKAAIVLPEQTKQSVFGVLLPMQMTCSLLVDLQH